MTYLNGISGPAGMTPINDPMDLDNPVQPRRAESMDQDALAEKALSERVAVLYGEKGFFLALSESVLIHLMTFMNPSSFRNLTETSKETHQTVMALFQVKHHSIDCPFNLGVRFTLESLERDQSEISEKILIFDEARIVTNDIMAAVEMTRGEIRVALSYGFFEGSLYRFSQHLLALKRAREAYNSTAPQDQQITLKRMFENYDQDRKSIEEAFNRGKTNCIHPITLRGLVIPPEFSKLKTLSKLFYQSFESYTAFPKEIFTFIQLKKLSLKFSRRFSLEGIGNLKRLEYFNLEGKLESLPSEIGNLPNLRKLSLGGCLGLKTLPDSIVHLKLDMLNITGLNIVIENLSPSVQEWLDKIPDLRKRSPSPDDFYLRRRPINADF